MATNKTIPNPLPPGAEQLAVVDDVIGQIEKVSRTAMDKQTANNRVGHRCPLLGGKADMIYCGANVCF